MQFFCIAGIFGLILCIMADNYLEKKMAEHLSGAAKSAGSVLRRPGSAVFAFGRPPVFVDSDDINNCERVLRRLGEAGARVCFCGEGKAGQLLAQNTATCCAGRTFELALAAAVKRHGVPEVYIAIGCEPAVAAEHCRASGAKRAICIGPDTFACDGVTVHHIHPECKDIASAALFLCLPEAEWLQATEIH